MPLSEAQKSLRNWFRRHGWRTNNTPTGRGFYLESPVLNNAGGLRMEFDPKANEYRYYCYETFAAMELDRMDCNTVMIQIVRRKHWWARDESVPLGDHSRFGWIPSDDFTAWERKAYTVIPARDLIALADLIKVARDDNPTRKQDIAKPIDQFSHRWIGVNSSYEEIKEAFSNEKKGGATPDENDN